MIIAEKSGHYVHYEEPDTVIEAIRNVVTAVRKSRLGPQIKKSPHDGRALAASQPTAAPRSGPPSESDVMAGCGSLFLEGRMMTGGMRFSALARSLGGSIVNRLVDDRTGLDSYYAFTLTYAPQPRPGTDGSAATGDAPSTLPHCKSNWA